MERLDGLHIVELRDLSGNGVEEAGSATPFPKLSLDFTIVTLDTRFSTYNNTGNNTAALSILEVHALP